MKLGGSLYGDPLLPAWLDTLTQVGGGRVVIVCGGGGFADEVRRQQAAWRFDDLAAHNMAVLAMAQGAFMLQALCPGLQRAGHVDDIQRVLRTGAAAIWAPFDLLRDKADASTHWGVTSDSIALALARRLNAERLVVVKSCVIAEGASLQALSAEGVLDTAFAQGAAGAGFDIDIVQRDDLALVREQLLGGGGRGAAVAEARRR